MDKLDWGVLSLVCHILRPLRYSAPPRNDSNELLCYFHDA